MRVIESSDRSLLVVFSDEISAAAHRDVARMTPLLIGLPGVLNVHPAYASILIDFEPLKTPRQDLERAADALYAQLAGPLPRTRVIEVPVYYGGEYGPDLDDVAALSGHTPAEVVALHSSPEYLVYFLGFSPGFPYLGGMPDSIAVPRLATPRSRVPAGSVAIGGRQSGIYPLASPGGWRIIGRTPLQLFQPDREPPVLLQMGDHVKFVPVTKSGI
jgi:KipI family sensor histidine kinase inhibitor